MINVITDHGSSFRGLAAYVLHDIGSTDSSERVAWTHTHQLSTDDPEKAWRIMAATAMSQAELKARAGGSNAGPKSNKHVMHYILSWHPDEREGLTKDEMLAAAKASMTYLGTYEGEKLGRGKHAKRTQFADEHQALIVCHDDGPGENPHVHVMLSRVHPEHGVMLPSNYTKEKLSAWALDYRRSQGKEHLCEQRVKNWAKKAMGIITNNPRKPRNIYEQEQAIEQADPASRKKALLEEQARRAKALNAKDKAMQRRQAEAMRRLEARHLRAERAERAKALDAIKAKQTEVKARYTPRINQLAERQADEKMAFQEVRGTAAGHVRNFMNAVKAKEWMRDLRTTPIHALTHGMKLAVSAGFQEQQMLSRHRHERGQLNGQMKAEQGQATREIRMDEGLKRIELQQTFHEQRNDLLLKQGMERAKLKAEWKQLDLDRLTTEAEGSRGPEAESSPSGGGREKTKEQTKQSDNETNLSDQMQAHPPGVSDVPSARDLDALRERSKQVRQRHKPNQNERDHEGRDHD